MKIILRSLVFLLCFACAVAWWREVAISQPFNQLFLRTTEFIRTPRQYVPSYRYKFPDQHFRSKDGTNVYTFGLQTSYGARITLHDSSKSQPDLRITLNEEVLDEEEEWVCYAEYMGSKKPHKFSIPCYLELYSDSYMWFTLLTQKNYIALYENGISSPLLDLTQKDIKATVNFNKYDSFTVSSEELAMWDFQGNQLVDEDLYEADLDKTLTKALKTVKQNYLKVKRHTWRCDHATVEKNRPHNKVMKYKYIRFAQSYCPSWVLQPYVDSSNYQEAILRVNGIVLPNRRAFNADKYFKNDF